MTCRMEVAVDGPGSPLVGCSPVVAETVADGFRCLAYIHFRTFTTYDDIDAIGARTGEGFSEMEWLFCDSRTDGMVGKEFRTGSTQGTVAGFNTVVF